MKNTTRTNARTRAHAMHTRAHATRDASIRNHENNEYVAYARAHVVQRAYTIDDLIDEQFAHINAHAFASTSLLCACDCIVFLRESKRLYSRAIEHERDIVINFECNRAHIDAYCRSIRMICEHVAC